KSLELKPEFAFSLYSLAYVYLRQGRYQEAIPPSQKLMGVEPKHIFGNHALGVAYAQTGNRTGAMQQYYVLQTIDPKLAADLLKLIPK
ncbi:MAG TPA: bacterial transcriptional activator domain-containing protein, partial [Pyrinomonadaceae bacterium]|nr:bacterial transcriptional activator domain-containing protein [Pyrinomonadaceae bacterium]